MQKRKRHLLGTRVMEGMLCGVKSICKLLVKLMDFTCHKFIINENCMRKILKTCRIEMRLDLYGQNLYLTL